MAVTIEDIIAQAGDIISKYKNKELSFVKMVVEVVKLVESIASELNTEIGDLTVEGKTKKEIAVILINKAVDIPFVPESTEAWLIGSVIDIVVGWLNKTGVFKHS